MGKPQVVTDSAHQLITCLAKALPFTKCGKVDLARIFQQLFTLMCAQEITEGTSELHTKDETKQTFVFVFFFKFLSDILPLLKMI